MYVVPHCGALFKFISLQTPSLHLQTVTEHKEWVRTQLCNWKGIHFMGHYHYHYHQDQLWISNTKGHIWTPFMESTISLLLPWVTHYISYLHFATKFKMGFKMFFSITCFFFSPRFLSDFQFCGSLGASWIWVQYNCLPCPLCKICTLVRINYFLGSPSNGLKFYQKLGELFLFINIILL